MLVFVCNAVHADVYKSINADGEVVYSDVPSKDSRRMEMPETPAYTPPPVPVAGKVERKVVANDFYKSFVMTKPANETTLRNNLGIVMLETALTPSLQTRLRHRMQFYLDGNPHGNPSDRTAVTMSDIDRGEHRLSASVVDPDGNVLISTADVTVFVKRESRLQGREGDGSVDFPDNPDVPGDSPANPGNITDNPNLLTDNPNILSENPNIKSKNPNARSQNPNVRSTNPNIINPKKHPSPAPQSK